MALRRDQTLKELGDFARLVVRAGYQPPPVVHQNVSEFVRAEVDDAAAAERLTGELVAEAEAELARDMAGWPDRTDNDFLGDALADLRAAGYLVLEYCADHFDASAALSANPGAAGIVFFTETDVWHAVTEGMLELKAWHADTSNMVAADPELDLLLDILARHGLPARFDEGRVEVSMTWRRRPAPATGT